MNEKLMQALATRGVTHVRSVVLGEYEGASAHFVEGELFECRDCAPAQWAVVPNERSLPGLLAAAGEAEAEAEAEAGDHKTAVIRGIASSTSVDSYGTEMSKNFLDQMAEQFTAGVRYVPTHSRSEWNEEMGVTTGATVRASTVRAAADASEQGYVLEVDIELDLEEPDALKLYKRVQKGKPVGQSIGAFFDRMVFVEDERGDITRMIIDSGRLDHLAATGRPSNPDSDKLSLIRSALAETRGASLGSFLSKAVAKYVKDKDTTRAAVVDAVAEKAGIEPSTVREILAGSIKCPPITRLQAFADVLGISLESIEGAAASDSCKYTRSEEVEVVSAPSEDTPTMEASMAIDESQLTELLAGLAADRATATAEREAIAAERAATLQVLAALAERAAAPVAVAAPVAAAAAPVVEDAALIAARAEAAALRNQLDSFVQTGRHTTEAVGFVPETVQCKSDLDVLSERATERGLSTFARALQSPQVVRSMGNSGRVNSEESASAMAALIRAASLDGILDNIVKL